MVVKHVSEDEHADEVGQPFVRVRGVDVETRSIDLRDIHLELRRRALRRAYDLLSSTGPESGARGLKELGFGAEHVFVDLEGVSFLPDEDGDHVVEVVAVAFVNSVRPYHIEAFLRIAVPVIEAILTRRALV